MESSLCDTCAALDLKSLIYGPYAAPNASSNVPLGSLESIIQRSDSCQLCGLVSDALRERYKRTPSSHMSDVYYTRWPPSDISVDGYESEGKYEDEDEDNDSNHESASTKRDEIEKYGLPVTWSDQPIQCHIAPKFFCFQEGTPDPQGDEKGAKSTKEQTGLNQDPSKLRISRLQLALSPEPWVKFSSLDQVTLQAIWEKDDQAAVGAKRMGQSISPVGTGRKIGPLIELSRIRNWLRQCEDEHGEACARPAWVGSGEDHWGSLKLRVIDVEERRIVHLPPQGRYVGLSYVWGHNEEALKLRLESCLTTRNSSRLQEVNGLDILAIPQTIQDAMSLTRDLGERYLWVDALCILQDDMSDLSAQTSRMDLVYSGALFTILAACGENSESGLAGLAERSRNIFHRSIRVSADGLCLATTSAMSAQDGLPRSIWNKRGWTFQERLLSRRTLVFTSSQVYWLCESATWDEETILEPTEPPIWILPQALGCNDEWDDGYPKFSKQALGIYITQYSSRKFTFPADAFSAFLGIIRRYEHLNDEEVFWGLPTEGFDQNLVWRYGTARRKGMYSALVKGSLVHLPYPSWSWLGWTEFRGANIHNDFLESRRQRGDSKPELTFYSLMSDGSIRLVQSGSHHVKKPQQPSIDTPDDAGEPRTNPAPIWKGETTILGPIAQYNDQLISRVSALNVSEGGQNASPELPVHDTGRLVFRTSHVHTQALKDDSEDVIRLKIGNSLLELDAIFCSGAIPSSDSSAASSSPATSEMEFGEDESISVQDAPTSPNGEEKVLELKTAKEYPIDLIIISRCYDVGSGEATGELNIMIVKESDVEPGVWSRLGFVVIEENDWARFESHWKMVILE